MSKLKIYLEQKMSRLKFKSKNYTSGSARMTISELLEMLDQQILRKPLNQRDMKKNEVKTGAKLFFANIMYRLKFMTKLPAKILMAFPKKEFLFPSLGTLTFTSAEEDKEVLFYYQDGQHRLAYIKAIVNNEVALPTMFSIWNRGVNTILDEVYNAAKLEKINTENGIYFSMLPDSIQKQILAMEFDINIYSIDDEKHRRALYDLQNTTVVMTNNNRQKNLYAGIPIYDIINELCISLKDKYENCPDWLAKTKYDKVRKIVNGIKQETLIPLMYRCILATEVDLKHVENEEVVWDETTADSLANEFLRRREDMSVEDVQELLTKTCNKIISANNLISLTSKSTKADTGTFGGRLNLLTAAILEVRFLAQMKDKDLRNNVKKEYKTLDTSYDLLLKCNEYSKEVSSTYYNSDYTYSTLMNVLRASNKLIRDSHEEI